MLRQNLQSKMFIRGFTFSKGRQKETVQKEEFGLWYSLGQPHRKFQNKNCHSGFPRFPEMAWPLSPHLDLSLGVGHPTRCVTSGRAAHCSWGWLRRGRQLEAVYWPYHSPCSWSPSPSPKRDSGCICGLHMPSWNMGSTTLSLCHWEWWGSKGFYGDDSVREWKNTMGNVVVDLSEKAKSFSSLQCSNKWINK